MPRHMDLKNHIQNLRLMTTDDLIGVELSQYMQRKPVDLIRSIISCFAVEYWLLINIGKLTIAQACIYSGYLRH
jgi:hypothetical protein